MKQHITIEQSNEINNEQKERIQKWWIDNKTIGNIVLCNNREYVWGGGGHVDQHGNKEGLFLEQGTCCFQDRVEGENTWNGDIFPYNICYPLLSIGQMIEFLGDPDMYYTDENDGDYTWHVYAKSEKYFLEDELCDALWEAVKYVLNGSSN